MSEAYTFVEPIPQRGAITAAEVGNIGFAQ